MNHKPTRREDVLCRRLDKTETLLYSPQAKALHILNPTARLIWEACDGEHTVEDIVKTIESHYTGTEGNDVSGQVYQTLDTFAVQGLLQPNTWPSAASSQGAASGTEKLAPGPHPKGARRDPADSHCS